MTARAGDRVMAPLARLLLRVFFRRIDVEGADRLPAGPVLVVPNHVNGLVDGLVLMAVLPRYPRFLGKATLYRILPLAPFLHLAGVVPVHRTKDAEGTGERAVTRNDAAFRTCRDLLAKGGLVAVFPEGISHDEASVQSLRTGAARIALGAAFDDGVTGIETVAVGLVYDDKDRFRSRALVRIGEPEGLEGWRTRYEEDPRDAVRALTDRLARQLGQVAPMYESRQQELAYRRVASIVADGAARQDDIARALSAAASDGPAAAIRVAGLTDAADAYEADLALVGLSDEDIADGLSADRYRRRLGQSVVEAAATAPLAALGAVVHAVPYGIMKQIGKRPANEGMRATVKLLGCTVLFTAVYTAAGIVAGRRRGPLAGVAAFLLGPVCGYVTVRWAERVNRLGGVARARAVMNERRDVAASLEQQRADLVHATTALVTASARVAR